MLAPSVATGAKVEQPGPAQRSTVKPVSLAALSVHVRSIRVVDCAAAASAEGSTGTLVLPLAVLL